MVDGEPDRPILGLFEKHPSHPIRTAQLMRERVHFIGFVAERKYSEGLLRAETFFCPNPHLLPTEEEQRAAYASYALTKVRPGPHTR